MTNSIILAVGWVIVLLVNAFAEKNSDRRKQECG